MILLAALCFLLTARDLTAQEVHEEQERSGNDTNAGEAEFRQGGLQPGYPVLYGGGGGSSGYVNVLRNLYRPPSLGLTDKVKHWVKSFMNRRQQQQPYMKPYYSPPGQQQFEEFGKPVIVNGYKAVSVPLRQLQKYYKPYSQQQGSNYAGSSGLFGNPDAVFSSAGGQLFANGDGLFPSGDSAAGSSLFGDLYSSGGNQGMYHQANGGALYGGSDGGSSQFFNGASRATSSGELYASGASPVATVYNPNQSRYMSKRPSDSTLYTSSDQRRPESYSAKESPSGGYGMEPPSNGGYAVEPPSKDSADSSYSVSFPQQSAQLGSSRFQPVSFVQGKSS